MESVLQPNPFTVTTPENLTAEHARALFVDVFTDFYKIRDPGHSMLNGPRGSGKSMMFRYLEPDCQCAENKCRIKDLPFFAILISIKNSIVIPTDIRRLDTRHYRVVLNEHFMTVYIASKVFSYMAGLDFSSDTTTQSEASLFAGNCVIPRLRRCGLSSDRVPTLSGTTPNEIFRNIGHFFDELYGDVIQYVKRLSYSGAMQSFDGPLCGYLDFLRPVLAELRTLTFMPRGPIYLLLDDADVLSEIQTRVLNTWIGTRTSGDVSIKVSTQERYKTLAKVAGGMIESPHDYSEVNISDLYTTNRGKFLSRVRSIVKKRLEMAGVQADPEDFFPQYGPQEERVKEIAEEIRKGLHPDSGKGFRPSDDSLRYARPVYMKSLAGTKKSSSQYLYAGFAELVHISSGLIRYFLEPAALMFSEQQSRQSTRVEFIDPSIQNAEVYQMSLGLMTSEFDKITSDSDDLQTEDSSEVDAEVIQRSHFFEQKRLLRNLLVVLGGTFRQKLLSDDAERRVFSVAFSDSPIPQMESVIELGVRHGYFHRSSIGNKDGTGRTTLYILTRRLAPYFRLDPSGFAGYLFVQSTRLYEAIQHPERALRRIRDKGSEEALGESRQLILQFDSEDDVK